MNAWVTRTLWVLLAFTIAGLAYCCAMTWFDPQLKKEPPHTLQLSWLALDFTLGTLAAQFVTLIARRREKADG